MMSVAFPSVIYRTGANIFGAGFLFPLTTLHKKIAVIASIVFLAAGFWIKLSFFNFKPEIVDDLTLHKRDPTELLSYLTKYGKKVKELNLFSDLLEKASSKDQFLQDIFACCANLEKLNLELHRGDDALLELLKPLSSLKTLSLHFKDPIALSFTCTISPIGLNHLGAMVNLEHLDLSVSSLTDADLAFLNTLVSLQSLNFSFCDKITGWGLQFLKDLPRLNSLNLYSCDQFSDAGLQLVSDLKRLKFLDIRECKEISDDGLKHLMMNYPMRTGGSVSDPTSRNLHLKLGSKPPFFSTFIPGMLWPQRNKITYQNLMHLNWYHSVHVET